MWDVWQCNSSQSCKNLQQPLTNTPTHILYIETGFLPIQALIRARQFNFINRIKEGLVPNSPRSKLHERLEQEPTPFFQYYVNISNTYDSVDEIYKDIQALKMFHCSFVLLFSCLNSLIIHDYFVLLLSYCHFILLFYYSILLMNNEWVFARNSLKIHDCGLKFINYVWQ